jgi:hypothetical protein
MAKRKAVRKKIVKPVAIITGKLASFKKLKIPILKTNDSNGKKKLASRKGAKRLLNDKQMAQLKKMHDSGKHTPPVIAKKFKISMPTYYNYLNR